MIRHGMTVTAFLMMVTWMALLALSENPPVIVSFSGNGRLTWTNAPGVNGFAVQWASRPSGPWSNNWHGLDSIVTTGTATTACVPMFYRVTQAFTPADMRGNWMNIDQAHGFTHFVAQEDGIISESAFFISRAPSGYFTVGATGVVDLVIITGDEQVLLRGAFSDRDRILLGAPYTGAVIRRVEDESRCMGVWTGFLKQVTMPAIFYHPIRLEVDQRGLVTNMTGFGFNNIGRLFSLDDGPASGFFYTEGLNANEDPHDMIHVMGTHAGDQITGTYEADNPDVTGEVSLIRL